ncbi:isochorismatase family protein [Neomegalonema sp.]|uniref:isochorismatase family protein n=1 Tax=Neomegalonema sp. TaxID=2039713 RepID=UPI00261CBFDF|nr:isochorismatase family protein [Neomegalonema sp.]MDD2868141.1 isochorismatase family protein [Neomegalonema sp.]
MLMRREESFLLIVDLQGKLMPAMRRGDQALEVSGRLIRAARALGVPVRISEHCANRIGPTEEGLRALARPEEILAKTHFSIADEPQALAELRALGRPLAVITGAEAHVCVLQSALGLKAAGFAPVVAADAVSSRFEADETAGLARLAAAGVPVVTSEMVMFEWTADAQHPAFREILALIKER